MRSDRTVLRAENLGISYKVEQGWLAAVRDFEIEVQAGEIYGIVGESGSGKSTVARALMRYLPPNGRMEDGSRITLLGEDITHASTEQMRSIWGARMSLVPQNPRSALNPSIKIGKQLAEVLTQHTQLPSREVKQRVRAALERVNLADPHKLVNRYPHEISGGQAQRVVIAMALITSPQLIILDEPTTALDVTTEAVILNLVRDLIQAEDTAAIYVTHNLGVVAQLCERITVMYAGEIMADGPVYDIFYEPRHPYTIGLLNAIPQPGQTKRDRPLQTIPGRPPSLSELPHGCVYAPRCPLAIEICEEKPPLERIEGERLVRCHRWDEIAEGTINPKMVYASDEDAIATGEVSDERDRLLTIEGLTKHFATRRTLLDILRGDTPSPVRAVDNANLTVNKGRTYGLVGESGSGKTTLAKVLIGLFEKTSGRIDLLGVDLSAPLAERERHVLADLQMIFQSPQDSLNPYLTVGQSIRRPLMKLAGLSRSEADAEVQRLLKAVSLRGEYARRYPNELSGGEKQRVAIARAFASSPALIVADEPVSSLDVSVQSAVLNLLARLQEENKTSYIFISHDLSVVSYLADYIAVMYLGWLMEVGEAGDLFTPPLHPYTEALISAIPVPDPAKREETVLLGDNIPSARDVPSGCRFHTRCPHFLGDICVEEEPPWQQADDDHFYRCHIEPDELRQIQAENPVFDRVDNEQEG